MTELTRSERAQIAEILSRRANEIAGFSSEYTRQDTHHGSVELALTREINRLRDLAYLVCPPETEEEENSHD